MSIRRFAQVNAEGGCVASLYPWQAVRIGVLVEAETEVVNDAVKEIAEERCYADRCTASSVCKP